ncbi:MAG: Hpt domain-containing protein [Eubacteriales bacterium]|nr:Hpt domain-containing protein [Eubacteriales bacterium]
MTVKECYQVIGNYEEASARLGNDARIQKYLDKFRKDQSLDQMCQALEQQDYHQAFVCIHNLKGLYLNLALSRVGSSASELCDLLRNGKPEGDFSQMVDKVKQDHEQAVEMVGRLLASQPKEGE